MSQRRARNVIELGLASFAAAWTGRAEHLPHWLEFPDALLERIYFRAGGGLDWRLSALRTPRVRPAAWKVVVITGAPSWAEYWNCILARLGPDREMVVVDRPGFGASEPAGPVTDIALQAQALSPLLEAARGQKLLLVGQSYGAGVATAMAAAEPGRVDALLLVSGLLGDVGPTASRLVEWGSRIRGVIPRDLRNAVAEVLAQGPQLPSVRQAAAGLNIPLHIVHGDQDDFAPIAAARAFATELSTARTGVSFSAVSGDHFLANDPPDLLLAEIEAAIAAASRDRVHRGLIDRAKAWLGQRAAAPATHRPIVASGG